MSDFRTVTQAWAEAWAHRRVFVPVYLFLRVLAFAAIVPLVGIAINLAVSLSNQSALTDQDIALFLLTPGGFVAALAVASILLLAEVLSFTVMTATLRSEEYSLIPALRAGLFTVLGRVRSLFVFALLFVLRVMALALPFLVAGLLLAMWQLTEFDINYYLTFKPPEFRLTIAIVAVLVLIMVVAIVMKASAWAVGLHLVIFDRVAPAAAFGKSAELMQGRRMRLNVQLLIWVGIRLAIAAVLGGIAGLALDLVPLNAEGGLKLALTITALIVLVWSVAGLVLQAVALGALTCVLDGFYGQPRREIQTPPEQVAASLRSRIVVAGGALIAVAVAGIWAGTAMMDAVQAEDQVEIIAHRGAAGARPENTMASVELAIEEGADWVEIDVQETAEGEVAVMHDSDFMKLALTNLKIWDATAEDLAGIDIGSWFDPAYAEERTPMLRDVLAAAKGRSRVLIELKYYGHDVDLENRVIALVEEAGMADQIAIMSLKYPAVLKMQSLRPNWRTGVLAATAVGDLAGLQGDFIAVNAGIANAALINAVHSAGKDLYVWTVNDPLEMSRMISKGVDGLITDEPALARKVLAVRAELSTPERLVLWISQTLGMELNGKTYRDNSP